VGKTPNEWASGFLEEKSSLANMPMGKRRSTDEAQVDRF